MLEHLFGSKTRLKILRAFFRDSEKAYYVRELSRLVDSQINAIRRELELLLKADLIKETEPGKEVDKSGQGASLRKYYSLNTESILYPEFQALLLKAKILGEQKFVEEITKKCGEVKLFLLTGKFTGDERAPSDILLVGKIKEKVVARLINKYEKETGIDILYTLMTEKEFSDRRHVMDKFLYSLFEAKNIKVVDKIGS